MLLRRNPSVSFITGLALLVLPPVLIGCNAAFVTPTASTTPSAGMALGGSVHGGQQPVTSAHVYLFAAGTTGYGSAPSSLLNTSTAGVSSDASGNGYVTTDASGDWIISATTPVPLRAVSSISSRSAEIPA